MSDEREYREEGGLTTADLAAPRAERPPEAVEEPMTAESGRAEPLFPTSEADGLRRRWSDIQAGFVDEPRRAVEEADELVATAIKRLAETFADERARLETQWDRGDDVSTEDLRQTLRRYRSFFDRILSL